MTDAVHSVIETQLAALGIPAQIDTEAYPSIVALFEEALATFRDEAACSSVGRTLSYGELDRLSADFAGWLQSILWRAWARYAQAWSWSIPTLSIPSVNLSTN